MSQDTTLKKLQVVLTGNTTQLQTAMNQAQQATKTATDNIQRGLGKVESALKSVAKIAATYISVKAIVNFGKSCVQLGSDLSEVQNVVDTTFGSMSGAIDTFAKDAIKNFGLSETAAKKYSSTMGSMLKSMGMNQKQTLSMSTTLAGLAGDMASFYNISTDEAFSKIRSGISGETEPLKQLGINLSVANLEAYALSQGITKSYNSMTQAEQVMLRYNYLLKSTADAQGDFSKTSGSWANQVRILSENFNKLKATLGQGLIMALTPVIQLINSLLEKLQELAEAFKYLMADILGIDLGEETIQQSVELADDLSDVSDMAYDTSDSVDSISDSLKDANKEAKKFLFSFDEIHALQSDDDKDASSLEDQLSLDTNVKPIDELVTDNALAGLDEASEKIKHLGEDTAQKSGLSDAAKEKIGNAVDKAKEVLGKVVDAVEDAVPPVVDAVKGPVQAVVGIYDTVDGSFSGNQEKQAVGGILSIEGQDNIKKSIGGIVAWLKEHIAGVKDASEDFQKEWAEESAIQRKYKTLKAIGYTGADHDLGILDRVFNGNEDAYKDQRRKEFAFEAWQYVTPEMENRFKNGQWTAEDNEYLTNKLFNPWENDTQARWYYNQILQADPGNVDAEIALEFLNDVRDMWKEIEANEHFGEIYGDSIPDNPKEPPEPPTTPLTKADVQEAMVAAINSMPAVETGVYLDGEDVGTLVMNALFGRNVRINPEAAVAEG